MPGGYNTTAFGLNHPRDWAEFWDVKGFPGGCMLEDMSAEFPSLEFALLARRGAYGPALASRR